MRFPAADVFPYPLASCPPLALFSPHFIAHPPVVRASNPRQLKASTALSLAAPMSIFYDIDPTLWKPEWPVIVLSDITTGLASEEDRDYIWSAFGVPAFEYLLDDDGALLATECEAHEGLHLLKPAAVPEQSLSYNLCPCGKSGARLMGVNAIIEKAVDLRTPLQEWRNWQTHQT